MHFIALEANRARLESLHELREKRSGLTEAQRIDNRRKEVAASDGDFTRLVQADRNAIDLAIHLDSFLDDVAIYSDVTSQEALYWRSTYDPTVGVYMGSIYGGAPSTFYTRQDYYAPLTPFTVDTEAVKVPNIGLTLDPNKLKLRDSAITRQAEAIKLKGEQFLFATILNQPISTSIADAITNFVSTGNPYNNKTVYIVDPNVQAGTYETTNIVSLPGEGGLTPLFLENLTSTAMLMGRTIRTVHIPIAGQPWRKLMRSANLTISANAPLPNSPNQGLRSLAPSQMEDILNKNLQTGLVLNWYGMPLKFKANNALPQGYCFCTTDQPAAEVFNVTDARVSVDYVKDPQNPTFSHHYEKYSWAIGAPDPWARNVIVGEFGNTSNL